MPFSKTHQFKGVTVGKLDGKVAVITGGSTGLALAGAKLFVEEGAYVFIQGRRQEALDDAVKVIGRNVTAVQGDASDLDDLDRLYDTVKREKGSIDVLWASAGFGEPGVLGRSRRNSSNAPSRSTRAARCSPCRRHCR
jgi:NAD(P)-dependent dehydrogenase (short-subunit alcohol dehydrogenase family)